MKTSSILLAVGLLSVPMASAQQYSIDWYTIDGGGGVSSGGGYTLSGTIGQPDAGALSGGSYTLEGGFWTGAIAVQQVNAPTLEIAFSATGTVKISWTPPVPGFVLQVSDAVEPTHWEDAPTGTQNPAFLSVPGPYQVRFYRLRKE